MKQEQTLKREDRILIGIYSTSMNYSLIALAIVAVLEICMLVYSFVNIPLFGPYIMQYRTFYVVLLASAVTMILLKFYVKEDMEHRFRILNIANPLAALIFFGWSLGITWFDASQFHVADPTVFMTFSLMIILSFFMVPKVYAVIVILADVLMMYLSVSVSGSLGPLINLFIFFIFQFVLGISYLHNKEKLAERILEERYNAERDIMTGFLNRRAYTEAMDRIGKEGMKKDFVYLSIDLNGLKDANDSLGHEAGDKLITGSAECMRECFGKKGKLYRTGGDEFAALLEVKEGEIEPLIAEYKKRMERWSQENGMSLSTSQGAAGHAEKPELSISELAILADERMYMDKALYYAASGKDRRRSGR